jgi:hypothetical protein
MENWAADFLNFKKGAPLPVACLALVLVIFAAAFFIFPSQSEAEDYDIFVDESYSGSDEDGSSDKPFKTIEEAVEAAGSKAKIYVKNGTYKEQVILTGKQELYGQDKNKTIIKSDGSSETVALQGNNKLKNITVSGGNSAVTFHGEGSLENCIIKDASKKGIDLTEGKGEVKIKDSKITDNGKGIYVQKGRTIAILDNEFTDNSEEGIDIREKVSGAISGNYVARNGEPGIEIVIGSADVLIKNNRIEKNKTSGIATQFYDSAPKTGQVKITKNTISRNGAYGIRCSSPGGGKIPDNYWNDSLDVTDNKIENNVGKAIAGACKLLSAITPEEEESNEAVESETSESYTDDLEKKEDEEEEKIRQEEFRQKEEQIKARAEAIRRQISELNQELDQKTEAIRNRSKILTFFIGNKPSEINSARQEANALRGKINELAILMKETENEEFKSELTGFISDLNSRLAEKEDFIREEEKRFGLFSWFVKLFNK